jgi:hypothetical protein
VYDITSRYCSDSDELSIHKTPFKFKEFDVCKYFVPVKNKFFIVEEELPSPVKHIHIPVAEESKIRYYNNEIVARKGEKYLQENKKDWDGGSRGKIITKGKRGKGWI